MFIDTGGLSEHHSNHIGQRDRLRFQRQLHHHGHVQQLGQLHLPYRSGHVTAVQPLLPPAPHRHGDLAPALLLLNP